MLKRKFYDKLLKWKDKPEKRALLVTGARQTGKTTLIRAFGRNEYERFIEINFLEQPERKNAFANDRSADHILLVLSAQLEIPLTRGPRTLVFLDEIQECPDARTAIKFLVEDGRFDYIESGSLLGVTDTTIPSYPVGFEQVERLFPMDFYEFAQACGISDAVFAHLETAYWKGVPVSDGIHEAMLKLFRYYTVTGGMPSVVQEFINSKDMGAVIEIQHSILALYQNDIAHYARTGQKKIRDIFDRIPSQLNDKNRRFMLADISKTARLTRYEGSFTWLRDAGVSLPCYNVEAPSLPLRLNRKRTMFKLFLADTGLLCAMSRGNIQAAILTGDLSVNRGSILENSIAQTLTANGFPLRYFIKHKYGEVDFVVPKDGHIIPVEVKSGRNFKSHAALTNILNVPEWNIRQAVVFCGGNVGTAGKIHYLPWYMAMFFVNDQPEHMPVNFDFSSLSVPEPSHGD